MAPRARWLLIAVLPLLIAGCGPGAQSPTATAQVSATSQATLPPDLSVTLTTQPKAVAPGGTTSVGIKTDAEADCEGFVYYTSTLGQLGEKVADASGKITWSWKVPTGTAKGTYPIDIACSTDEQGGSVSLSFTVK